METRLVIPIATALLAFAACVAPGETRAPNQVDYTSFRVLPRPLTLPRGSVTYDCGPEALSAVLRYYGREIGVEEISRQIYDPQRKGTPSPMLAPLARQLGFAASYSEGSIGRVKEAVDRDVPPIIMVKIADDLFHFFVVSGYSDRERMLLCEDYDANKRAIPYEDVERMWEATQYFYLEITPSTAETEYAIGEEFEGEGRYDDAIAAYRRAVTKDPEHAPSYLGIGNCKLALGRRDEAIEMYEKALQLYPGDPKAANNLAHALWERGRAEDLPRAREMAEKAVDAYNDRLLTTRRIVDSIPGQRARSPQAADAMRREVVQRLNEIEVELALAFGTLASIRYAMSDYALAVTAWKASYDLLPLAHDQLRAKRLAMIAKSYRELNVLSQYREYRKRAFEEAAPDLRAELHAELPEE